MYCFNQFEIAHPVELISGIIKHLNHMKAILECKLNLKTNL
jgi:hypothetical protein